MNINGTLLEINAFQVDQEECQRTFEDQFSFLSSQICVNSPPDRNGNYPDAWFKFKSFK
jgi:hypothetical protein